ncbi:MAG: MurR/RpiR family transcriptional regulator [Clostridia bacterium]|nr:MurR/RpiR family transcriptional regulator [Clostridia bacterium]
MIKFLPALRQRFSSMTPVEKRIASCILDAPAEVVNETITHLAARAGTSSGSVANFAVSMGCKGFSDMKIRVAQSLDQSEKPAFDGVDASDDPRKAMQKIISAAQASFQDTYDSLGDELAQAAEMLCKATRIEIYASGSSLPVGQDVHYRLLRLGLPAVIMPDPLLACISASQMNEGMVALAISHKGRTTTTLNAVQMAKSRKAKVLSLTSFQQSPLADLSDVTLVSVSGEALAYREAVVSRLTQLVIVDSLCAYIAAQRGMDAMRYLDDEIEVLEHYRKSDKEV